MYDLPSTHKNNKNAPPLCTLIHQMSTQPSLRPLLFTLFTSTSGAKMQTRFLIRGTNSRLQMKESPETFGSFKNVLETGLRKTLFHTRDTFAQGTTCCGMNMRLTHYLLFNLVCSNAFNCVRCTTFLYRSAYKGMW